MNHLWARVSRDVGGSCSVESHLTCGFDLTALQGALPTAVKYAWGVIDCCDILDPTTFTSKPCASKVFRTIYMSYAPSIWLCFWVYFVTGLLPEQVSLTARSWAAPACQPTLSSRGSRAASANASRRRFADRPPRAAVFLPARSAASALPYARCQFLEVTIPLR